MSWLDTWRERVENLCVENDQNCVTMNCPIYSACHSMSTDNTPMDMTDGQLEGLYSLAIDAWKKLAWMTDL